MVHDGGEEQEHETIDTSDTQSLLSFAFSLPHKFLENGLRGARLVVNMFTFSVSLPMS